MIYFKEILNSVFVKKIFKSFTIYTGANIIGKVTPFLLLPVLTRFLSTQDYGILATFIAVMGIVNVIIPLGCDSAVMRGYFDTGKKGFNFSKYIFNAIFINILVFSLLIIVLLFSDTFISSKVHISANWILLLPVMGLCTAVYNIAFKLFIFKQRPLPYAAASISNVFIEMALSIFFIVVLGLSWQGRILGITISNLLFFIAGLFLLFKNKLLNFSISYKYIKDILHYGIPVVFHSLGIMGVLAIDRFFLNRFVGLSVTGVYSVGYAISSIVGIFVGAFAMAWNPIFYEKLGKMHEALKVKLVKFTYLFFIGIVFATILLVISSPIILKVIVGKNFYGASKYILWIASGYIFQGMYIFIAGYIFYQKKTYLFAIIAGIIIVINIVLNYTLIKLNGAIGAAQATFITLLTRFALVWYFGNKVYPMPWFSFMKNIKTGKVL